ncbi:FMN reductase [Mesorhizobium hawassense]|uniref:FMN reductase n=1 Tax=Mesorhizobium hawassense TaxID=1209954 RepID=A0A330HTP7_9HYPH|nr:NADPH-dependent FMN reductase [Mesorhizobium hawassense]RAZ91765.1 FMN reductase [Mesorhizobium hawassense]
MFLTINQCSSTEPRPRPFVLGIGGTTRPNSTSESALRRALSLAEEAGATTEMFPGQLLSLPLYNPNSLYRTNEAEALIDALRRSDAVIFASPAYHGSISGLVKNAIDYIEDMREDNRPYLADRAVGAIISAYGDQAIGSTLSTMRNITHSLRGWPLPIGVGINALRCTFDEDCEPSDAHVDSQLRIMAQQAVRFAQMIASQRLSPSSCI